MPRITKAQSLIAKFNTTGLKQSEKIQLENLDEAHLVSSNKGVLVENEHGTQFPVSDLSPTEIQCFTYLLDRILHPSEPTKEFRITYRNEIYIKANSEEEAIEMFQNMPWDDLQQKAEFVERVSVDEES